MTSRDQEADAEPTDDDHHGLLDRLDDFKDRIEEAAIEAEFATGEREETVEEARSNALVRIARMTLGFIVVIIGIIALPLPGPGWLIIAAGLTILSRDVAWAERLLRYIRKRVPGIPEDGKIPPSSLATMALVTLAAVSASLWWTLGRGSDDIQPGNYDATFTAELEPGASIADTETVLVTLTEDGPVQVRSDTCDLTVEVEERSKAEFVLADPQATCGTDAVDDRLLAPDDDGTIRWELGYGTDGIVEWFFADDELTSITSPDGTAFEVATAS